AAAVFNVRENLAILRIVDVPLHQTTQQMIDAIRDPSLAKWVLALIATALFGKLFWDGRGRWMRLIAMLDLAAAAIGLYGIYDNAFLVWAGIPLFGGLVAIIAVFLRWR